MKKEVSKEIPVICPSCKVMVTESEMTDYKGDYICDGCAENRNMFENSDDPCGKGWNP